MKLGMILQVMFGCLTGQVPYVFHCLLRTADAACCVLMYGGGGMICKTKNKILVFQNKNFKRKN